MHNALESSFYECDSAGSCIWRIALPKAWLVDDNPVRLPANLAPSQGTVASTPQDSGTIWPGLVLIAMISAVAFSARNLTGITVFSPMILAVVVGMIFSNFVGAPLTTKAGIAFSQRRLLRLAIVLLGFQLTLEQVLSIGVAGIGIVLLTLVSTFFFTMSLGRLLRVDHKLAELIAAGTSICGASAIVATNIVTNARDEDVAYAVASITLFGTIAMLGFPLLAPAFGLDQNSFGLWAGSSIHEVAQVIGAGFQNGTQAGETATVAKLTRVAMLAPMVIVLGFLVGRNTDGGRVVRPPVPWFVIAFAAIVIINSIVNVPAEAKSAIVLVTTILLAMGLAAMGLQADVSEIRSRGVRPLILAFSAFLFIASLSLALVKLVG